MKKHGFWGGYFAAVVVVAGLSVSPTPVVATSATAPQTPSSREPQNLAALAARLAGAEVVVLGEMHDNGAHHQVQAEMIRALTPRAVVWEMITQEQAETLTENLLKDPEATAAALAWETSGWPDFGLYAPVFQAAASAQHFGALVPRAESQAALKAGVASHFGADAARFGLDQPLPEDEQADREADQMVNHCNAMPAEMLPMMVDFQRLRDTSLAAAAERAWHQTGGPVVVITGNGHARKDRGLPVYLHRAAPDLEILSLGQMEAGQISGEFDMTYSSPPVDRPDPCLAFRKSE